MAKPRPMARQALLSAFAGESMAHMRYLVFAERADREGYPNVARLFRAVAYAEQVHAGNHYNRLREFDEDAEVYAGTPLGPGNASKNLSLAIRGEEFEVEEMYPAYIAVAEAQGDRASATSFKWALEAEKIHAELFKEAKKHVDKGEDMPLTGKIWICPVCGYTYIGSRPPERCPICGALGEKFKGF